MYELAEIECPRDTPDGTRLEVLIPGRQLSRLINDKGIKKVEIRLDDGRHISAEQRKKIYATVRDISDWSGYIPEVQKEWLKYLHISLTGCEYFSLSNCSMDTAREFINTLMAYALENGIPLSDFGVNRTDDIDKYLWYTLKTKKCCVCGRDGEIHHVDRIGMAGTGTRLTIPNIERCAYAGSITRYATTGGSSASMRCTTYTASYSMKSRGTSRMHLNNISREYGRREGARCRDSGRDIENGEERRRPRLCPVCPDRHGT